MNFPEDPSDRLVDSLLREQARQKADEDLLQGIEEKLDAVPAALPAALPGRKKRFTFTRMAVAAAVVLCAGVMSWQASVRSERESSSSSALSSGVGELAQPPPQGRISKVWNEITGGSAPSEEPRHADPAVASMDARPAPESPPLPEAADSLAKLDQSEGKALGGKMAGAGTGHGQGTDQVFGRSPRLQEESEIRSRRASATNGTATYDIAAAGNRSGAATVVPADPYGASGGGFILPGEDASPLVPSIKAKRPAGDDGLSRENYGRLVDQPWKSPWKDALSTFSIDVDTASYTNLRRMILEGRQIPADAVRIEECVNYFDYQYVGPKGDSPFAVHGNLATCPWKPGHLLARVAIKGREVAKNARPSSNLVFLIDVSGSMNSPDKLPLLKRSLRMLIDELDERDRVGMVVYAGSEGVVLKPTLLDENGKSAAIQALEKLEAGGSTNGGAGIKRAYEMAAQNLVTDGVNRVILATDGDFNVGTTGQGDLVSLVKKGAAGKVNLSVLGFGTGNFNDAMLEAITNEGDGNYFYIDGDNEARRVLLQKLSGTLVTIAKDVKIQVEFNPGKVQAYRLIGYANRILRNEDFANDKVDAGDIGAGHTVTAFYEIVPNGVEAPETGVVDGLRYQRPAGKEAVESDDWFTLKLRHKHPQGDVSSLIETPVKGEPQAWEEAGNDFRFASSVALFGMKLRQMPEMAGVSWGKIAEMVGPALAEDPQEQRAGFVELVKKLQESRHELTFSATIEIGGQVTRPGTVALGEGMTVSQAIESAGGFNAYAGRYLRMVRNAKLYVLDKKNRGHLNILLHAGDSLIANSMEENDAMYRSVNPIEDLFERRNLLPEEKKVASSEMEVIEKLRYVKDESTMWYVQFGIESGGKWAPRFEGRTSEGRRIQNRVSAIEMLSPGDTFFQDGEMAGRFKFSGILEKDVMNERTGMTQKVKFAMYEDLKANKQGEKYEAQYGLPDAELTSHAYYDRTAVLRLSSGGEFKVEERTKFTLPGDASLKDYFLKKVTPEAIEVEYVNSSGTRETVEIPKDVGR